MNSHPAILFLWQQTDSANTQDYLVPPCKVTKHCESVDPGYTFPKMFTVWQLNEIPFSLQEINCTREASGIFSGYCTEWSWLSAVQLPLCVDLECRKGSPSWKLISQTDSNVGSINTEGLPSILSGCLVWFSSRLCVCLWLSVCTYLSLSVLLWELTEDVCVDGRPRLKMSFFHGSWLSVEGPFCVLASLYVSVCLCLCQCISMSVYVFVCRRVCGNWQKPFAWEGGPDWRCPSPNQDWGADEPL